MTLLYLVAAWIAGILIASGSHAPLWGWLAAAILATTAGLVARPNYGWRLAAVCATALTLGAARFAWAERPLPEDHIAHYAGTGYTTVTGVIVRDADVREHHVNLRIQTESLAQNGTTVEVRGLLLAQAPRYGSYHYGDRVRIKGPILVPPEFDDFSYRDYLARQGIHALVANANVDHVASDQGQPWLSFLYSLKARVQRTIDRLLPSPQGPLLSGILIGVESSISPDVRDAFNRTGTAHIIAISGANIIVIIRALMGLLKPALGVRRAGWLTMFSIAGYVLLVGADAAVVRAALMGGLSILAWQLGRRAYGLTSLAFSIFLMSAWSPYFLWDIGFQLSVAATAGLVLLGDPITESLRRLLGRVFSNSTAYRVTRWLSEPFTVSLAAQVATTPLILMYFGRFSVVALIANLLIVPVQPYIMTGGWLAVIVGSLVPPVGQLAGWIVWLPLTYTLEIVGRLGELDWASYDFRLTPDSAWGFYVLLGGCAWLALQHSEDRSALLRLLQQRAAATALLGAGLCMTALVWVAALNQPDGKLHVWFLDVGRGHAVLIETPDGAQILIDGGPNPSRLRAAVGEVLPFWDRTIELLIISHPKDSAIAALPALLDHYRASQIVTNGQASSSESYRALETSFVKHDISTMSVTAGYHIETGDRVVLEIIHPQQTPGNNDKPDDFSLVIRLTYGEASFLITSELSSDAYNGMTQAGWFVGSTVLELPDFGSKEANPAHFLEAVRPQIAVVGVEAGNRSQLPDPQVSETIHALTGLALFRTDQHGNIEIVTDGQQLQVISHR